MSQIERISIGLSADSADFTRDVTASAQALEQLGAQAEKTQGALGGMTFRAPAAATAGGESSGGGLQDSARTAALLGSQMAGGFAPVIGVFARVEGAIGRIEVVLDRVGGTITTLARRIDESLKLPILDRTLGKVQGVLSGAIGGGARVAEKAIESVVGAAQKLGGVPSLDGLASKLEGVRRRALEMRGAVIEATRLPRPVSETNALPPPASLPPPSPEVVEIIAQRNPPKRDGTQGEHYRQKAPRGPDGRFVPRTPPAPPAPPPPTPTPPTPALPQSSTARKLFGPELSAGYSALAKAAGVASGAIRGVQAAAAAVRPVLIGLQPVAKVAFGAIDLGAKAAIGSVRLVAKGVDLSLGGMRNTVNFVQWLNKVKGLWTNLGDVAGKSLSEIDGRAAKTASVLAKMVYVLAPGAALAGLSALSGGLLSIAPAAGKAAASVAQLALRVTGVGAVFRGLSLFIPFSRLTAESQKSSAAVNLVKGSVDRTAAAVKSFGGQVLMAFGFFGTAYKVVEFFRGGIAGAMNLAETTSKTKEVFGQFTGQVTAQAEAMAAAYGLPKQAQLDAASSFGLIFQGAGMAGRGTADLSNQMAKLAADASSFYNVPLDQALEKIRSGLVGESEPMRGFGVLLSESAVKAHAYASGIAKAGEELTEQQKVTARAALIERGLAKSTGDLERTQGSVANQVRKNEGNWANFATTLGELVMPLYAKHVQSSNGMFAALSSGFAANKALFQGWVDSIGAGMDFVGRILRNAGGYWELFQLSARQSISNAVEYIGTLPENLVIIGQYIGKNWTKLIVDAVNLVGKSFANLGDNLGNLTNALYDWAQGKGFNFEWKGLLDGFEATAEQLPELVKPHLTDLTQEMAEVSMRIEAKEGKRAEDAVKAAGPPPPSLPGPDADAAGDAQGKKSKDKEIKPFAEAVEFGSKEAHSAELKARSSLGKDKDASSKETAKNTGGLLAEAKNQTQLLNRLTARQSPSLTPYAL